MATETYSEFKAEKDTFWHHATRYTKGNEDEPFVNEIAYMMVTLHKTGA